MKGTRKHVGTMRNTHLVSYGAKQYAKERTRIKYIWYRPTGDATLNGTDAVCFLVYVGRISKLKTCLCDSMINIFPFQFPSKYK